MTAITRRALMGAFYQYADTVGFNVGSFDIGGNDCAGI